jgi:hypothetical protein
MQGFVNSRAIATSGSIALTLSGCCYIVSSNSDFSKFSIYSTQNYLLMNNISGQLIGTPDHLLAEMNRKTPCT